MVLLVLGALTLDVSLVVFRVDRVAVALPEGPGTTWVLVGLDSRAALPEGASVEDFGSTDEVRGSRADVVLIVHDSGEHTSAFSVSRDVVVSRRASPGRLALSWLDGPQSTVDALCGLGVAADHLVAVDLAGFAAVVDAAGGLDVDVPEPVRDRLAGLELPAAGPRHVDGATALAMVRSRHPEHLVGGKWVAAPEDPDGRATTAGTVVSALSGAVDSARWRPWRLQSLAWAASGALTVDTGTSTGELLALAGTELDEVEVLPVGEAVDGTLARFPTDATSSALDAAGMSCG
ncbi:LCP family protein [Blastococcus saxobsidens]|uniref:Cell envelope-related function transcriptional attenuator common domain n=1 Tax=Blastococcus saxobsidens (strain DD2) TaxID=1146883 RepID=H6RVW4_BLASD|nr:LCP family protein [Blastococcus saxobsidens]CCG04594.1 Cell envelope-related function transcriptional attenuator common domain [Blastococcus saxobsidens DD2]